MENEDGPLLGRQATEATLDAIALDDRRFYARAFLSFGRQQSEFHDRPTAISAGLPIAGADDKPVDPGIESIEVAQSGDIAPREDEGVLDGILSPFRAAENDASDSVQPTDRRRRQRREGVMITFPSQGYEISLHAGRRVRRDALFALSTCTGAELLQEFPNGA